MGGKPSHPGLNAHNSSQIKMLEEFVKHVWLMLDFSFHKLSTSLVTLASSSSDASVFRVNGFSGHISGSLSHVGPFHHSSALVTLPPRLARSTGLSAVRTCLDGICGPMFSYILHVTNDNLPILTISNNAVKGNGAVQPTLDCRLG